MTREGLAKMPIGLIPTAFVAALLSLPEVKLCLIHWACFPWQRQHRKEARMARRPTVELAETLCETSGPHPHCDLRFGYITQFLYYFNSTGSTEFAGECEFFVVPGNRNVLPN
jgi:hypothetical protein